ncbi:MAG TPA: hypothetical protein VLA49_05540 [Anaerolineales bacterium]|nr:hypothetical protein [Anaerolineales bacterium]
MKVLSRWSGLIGTWGGLIWAILFFMEATNSAFDLRDLLLNQPAPALVLVLGVLFQAAGYYGLASTSLDLPIPRISATVCAAGALVQSVALLAVSTFGLGAAWLLGILGELAITIALATFAIVSLPTELPRLIKTIPFLMVPVYFVGWALDPGSFPAAPLDFVNLSATLYGLLWLPFGLAIWNNHWHQIGLKARS